MKTTDKNYSYADADKEPIITALLESDCDEDGVETAIEHIQDTITIYLKVRADSENLPQPKIRRETIERALTDSSLEADWLQDLIQFDNRESILNRLLEFPLKAGRQKNNAWDFLVGALADTYLYSTGRRPTITWREDKGKYEGKFITFVQTCVKPLGPRHVKSNAALAISIKRVLKVAPAE